MSRRNAKAAAAGTSSASVPDRTTNLDAASGGAPAPAASDAPTAAHAKRLFIIALVAAVTWWATLAVLAIFAANPVTFNRAQILQADYVVTATVQDAVTGRITVEKEWKHGFTFPSDEIVVSNLSGADARTGRKYLIPLSSEPDDKFSVTEPKLPTFNDPDVRTLTAGEATAWRGRVTSGSAKIENGARELTVGDTIDRDVPLTSGKIQIVRIGPPYVYPATDDVATRFDKFQAGLVLDQLNAFDPRK